MRSVLTVYSCLAKVFNIRTKTLVRLYVGVRKVRRISLNGGQPSTFCSGTLQSPSILPDVVPTGFIDLSISFDMLLKSTKFSGIVFMRFS